jgi:hypothetical protein
MSTFTFEELTKQQKQVQLKSDAAWAKLSVKMAEAVDAFADDAEFHRCHEEIEVVQNEIDALAKEEESILDEMDKLIDYAA